MRHFGFYVGPRNLWGNVQGPTILRTLAPNSCQILRGMGRNIWDEKEIKVKKRLNDLFITYLIGTQSILLVCSRL